MEFTSLNIRQVTQNDSVSAPIYKQVTTKEGKTVTIPYLEMLKNENIIKLGYCCETKGSIYPIFINHKPFIIGNSGIYEVQAETYINENKEEATAVVAIENVMVPADINFTLDFVTTTT